MKKSLLIILAGVFAPTVWAADFVDSAKVIASAPIYERVSEPKQECWYETVSSTAPVPQPQEERSLGGALLGGVLGGVVGNQVGAGNGKTAATAAGAIAGALIGDRTSNANAGQAQVAQPSSRTEQHCRQIENYRDVIRGYNVTYRYNGRDVTVRLPYQPGEKVQVGVSLIR
ncbi:MAG: glycine zipper 2TM domain-containing protein [Pseudomonadota bacterium]